MVSKLVQFSFYFLPSSAVEVDKSVHDDDVAVNVWFKCVFSLIEERYLDTHLLCSVSDESFVGAASIRSPRGSAQSKDNGRHHRGFPAPVGSGQEVEALVRLVHVFSVTHEVLEMDFQDHSGLTGPGLHFGTLFASFFFIWRILSGLFPTRRPGGGHTIIRSPDSLDRFGTHSKEIGEKKKKNKKPEFRFPVASDIS